MIKTFVGKNSFELRNTLDRIVNSVEKEFGDLAIERLDGSEVEMSTIFTTVSSLPFLSPKKLVILHNIEANSQASQKIEEIISSVAEGVELIFIEPEIDRRKSLFKILKTKTELTDFSEMRPQDLPGWLVNYCKNKGANLTQIDAVYLVDRVGANQQILASEIEKLIIYSEKIKRENIDLLTSRAIQSTIFSLLDAAFSGNKTKAIKLYREQRELKLEPQYIVAMLSWQLNLLALAVYANPRTEDSILRAGQSPYSARKSLELSKQITKKQIKKMIIELSEIDAQIKTSADADSALELYILNL